MHQFGKVVFPLVVNTICNCFVTIFLASVQTDHNLPARLSHLFYDSELISHGIDCDHHSSNIVRLDNLWNCGDFI